jgi:TolA-binding protein
MSQETSPAPRALLPWAMLLIVTGCAVAMIGGTFWRDRRDAVAAAELIRVQQKTIWDLNRQIDHMNGDIRAMQQGITEMQQEIIRLRKTNP